LDDLDGVAVRVGRPGDQQTIEPPVRCGDADLLAIEHEVDVDH
jgi:hypothetical protein